MLSCLLVDFDKNFIQVYLQNSRVTFSFSCSISTSPAPLLSFTIGRCWGWCSQFSFHPVSRGRVLADVFQWSWSIVFRRVFVTSFRWNKAVHNWQCIQLITIRRIPLCFSRHDWQSRHFSCLIRCLLFFLVAIGGCELSFPSSSTLNSIAWLTYLSFPTSAGRSLPSFQLPLYTVVSA